MSIWDLELKKEMIQGKLVIGVATPAILSLTLAGMSAAWQDQSSNANNNASPSHTKSSAKAGSSATDSGFIMTAAMGGMAEVEMGRLATQRASSDAVKQFAQRMVDDHTKANDELTQIATSKGVTLPTGPDAKHQALMTRMQNLSGAAFDRAYLRNAGLKDHEKTVKLFQREIDKGKDPDVKAFASKNLPTIQDHLRMARDMSNAMSGTKSKTPAPSM